MSKPYRFTTALALLCLLIPVIGVAQTSPTTGALIGKVTDTSGAVLPGVTVTLSSPQLQGTRTSVTDENGQYVFPLLPPGTYRAEYSLSGVKSQVREAIQIAATQTTTQNVGMSLAVTETVTVTASQVVIDPTQTATVHTMKEDHLKYASVGSANRSYQNVLQQAPGVGGGANPQVSGANLAQNVFMLDGLNTTDPVTHTFGPNLAFDAIQEISIQTFGKDAEYGKASGGTINVITKSGGNRFSGSLDYRYNDPDFLTQGQEKIPGTNNLRFNKDVQTNKSKQPQATLGGPIMRDRLWFFGSSASPRTSRQAPNVFGFTPGPRNFTGWDSLGKLTFTPIENQTLQFRFFDSHANITNIQFSSSYRPEADARQTQHTRGMSLGYDSILSSRWLANIQLGHNPGSLGVEPMSGDFRTPGVTNADTTIRSVNYTNHQGREATRDELVASTTYYLERIGTHAFKVGVGYEKDKFSSFNNTVGDPTLIPGYNPAFCSPAFGFPANVNCVATFTVADNPARAVPIQQFTLSVLNPAHEVSAKQRSLYAQDQWNPIPRLTLRVGVRYDHIDWAVANNSVPEFDMVQPRVGVAYDILNNGNSIVHAYGGKIMDDNQLTLPNFGVVQPQIARVFRLNQTTKVYAPQGGASGGLTGGEYDPNLSPSFSNQYSLGFTQRIFRNTSLDVTWEKRTQHDLFEDFCNYDNPNAVQPDNCTITNNPAGLAVLYGDYQGVLTKIESRLTNNLDLVASWTHSRSRGSTESTQNQNTAFDNYPSNFTNTYGYLSDDARDRIKVNGYYRFPWQITLGGAYRWDSGTPWNVTQNANLLPTNPGISGTFFNEPRGSRRLPHFNQLDLQLQKDFQVGPAKIGLIGSVLNVLNSEIPLTINGTSTSATFGTYTSFQTPRRFEAGVRFEF
ncbi:MAG TPA: TonB-dependent receptor [Thermoanaerobaculia bacterium]|nr:TonB-dependent receptor [Thermoanaerobaculia bacterium]